MSLFDPSYFLHAANILLLLAYSVRDILWLRIFALASSLIAMPYFLRIALAWLLSRSPVILPIPGTSRIEHLEENVVATGLKIDGDQMQELGRAAHG
jgi:Aldo/keto reductase family